MAMKLTGPLSDRATWIAADCSIDKSLGVVGSRSAILLLREAFYGTTRFDDFAERVGLTPGVASTRLKELTGAGILEKRPYREAGARTRYDYHLTERGRGLLPVLLALQQWGNDQLQDGNGPIEVVDEDGKPVRVAVIGGGGRELDVEDLHVRPHRTA